MNEQTQSVETEATAVPTAPQPALRNPKSRRVRNGKIARLPLELRDSVSHSLYCGETHDEIAKDLQEDGYPDITRQNIGAWAKGGYQDWLETHQVFNSISLKADALQQYPRYTNKDALNVNKLNNFMLATRMNQVIELLDPKELARLVAADPDLFFRFIKEEFSRQEQERKLEYKIEDRKIDVRSRDHFRRKMEFMMLPESERPAALAKLEAEKERLLQEKQQLLNDQN